MAQTIPLTIICGFLGSGKTTLINHLLAAGFGEKKVAVIVNDFGKVSLDDSLIDSATEDTIVLRNGCVCCTLAADLTNGLQKLLASDSFDILVLECSGITAVAPLIKLVTDGFPDQVVVEDVITVVDAIRFPKLVKVVLPVKEQVRFATHIVLNRCDQADTAAITEVKEVIHDLNDQAHITQTSFCKVTFDEITSDLTPTLTDQGVTLDHAQEWATCTLTSQTIDSPETLRQLLEKLPESVQRLKGFVTTTTGQTYCVQFIPNDLQITSWAKTVSDDKKNLLTAIGSKEMVADLTSEYEGHFELRV